MFDLKFKTDNAAFSDGDGPREVARILRKIADDVENGRECGRVHDANGNTVGEWDMDIEADSDDEEEG